MCCEACELLNAMGLTDRCRLRVGRAGKTCIVQVASTRLGLSAAMARSIFVVRHDDAAAVTAAGVRVLTGVGKVPSDGRKDVWTAKVWDAQTGDLLHVLEGHRGEVTAVAFSRDAGILLTGDDNGRCVLWERETGRMIRRFSDDDRINAVVFLPDG